MNNTQDHPLRDLIVGDARDLDDRSRVTLIGNHASRLGAQRVLTRSDEHAPEYSLDGKLGRYYFGVIEQASHQDECPLAAYDRAKSLGHPLRWCSMACAVIDGRKGPEATPLDTSLPVILRGRLWIILSPGFGGGDHPRLAQIDAQAWLRQRMELAA